MDPSPDPDALPGDPTMPGPDPSPASAPPRRRDRRRALGLGAVAGLAVAWVAAHEWANTGTVRESIRARALETLRRRVGPVGVGEVRVDWLGRAVLGPVVVAAARTGGAPVLRIERVVVRPGLAALLAGRLEPASVRLLEARVAPGPGGGELRALVARLRGPAAGGDAGPGGRRRLPTIRVRDLTLVLERDGGAVDVGPFGVDLEVEPEGGAGATSFHGRVVLPGGGQVRVELRRDRSSARVRADLEAALPGDVPAALLRRLPVAPSAGRVEGWLELSGDADLRSGTGGIDLRARGVSVSGRRVGPAPLGPFAGTVRGGLRWDVRAGTASLSEGRVELGSGGEVAAAAAASLRAGPDPRLALDVALERVAWGDLLAALPAPLHPPDTVPAPAGALSARLRLEGPPARPADWSVDADVDLDDLRRSARAGPPSWLLSPFRWRPMDPAADEAPREVEVGPANPRFVPLASLPPWLPRAVTAAEDAGFWAHRGFDVQEIAEALRRGKGRLRGASTITQQLAKNLFLSPERTLSRKVREALSALALEAAVPKARLLEIYLNIAEWGPGVYGVGEAAAFWLGKDAREVTPKEAALLASVIPAPRRFHGRLVRSGVSGAWAERVADILSKMWLQGHLTDEQLLRALDEPLALAPAPPGSADADPAGRGGGGERPLDEEEEPGDARPEPADLEPAGAEPEPGSPGPAPAGPDAKRGGEPPGATGEADAPTRPRSPGDAPSSRPVDPSGSTPPR